jgi:hypothetical protein
LDRSCVFQIFLIKNLAMKYIGNVYSKEIMFKRYFKTFNIESFKKRLEGLKSIG